MNRKAAEFVDEHSDATRDALSLLALGILGWLSNFVSGLVADHAVYSTLANIVTLLSFVAAIVRTIFIFLDWKERRKMIEIKKTVKEEEDAERLNIIEDSINEKLKQQDLIQAPTAAEIHEILARNARDKRNK